MMDIKELREKFENSWPELIAREKIGYYTGGLYSPNTLASYDNRGNGIANPVRVGKKIAYPKKELIDWIMQRLEALNAKSEQ